MGAVLAAAALVLTACSGDPATPATDNVAGTPSASSSSSSTTPVIPASVEVTPADGAKGVKPTTPVVVTASSGTISEVTVKDAKGEAVEGDLSDGQWSSTGRLAPNTAYTVSVTAAGSDGTPSTTTSTFRTLKPKITATYGILYSGQTVGVGMPASIQFDSAVTTAAQRAEVEKLVSVTTVPKVEGHWGWLDNRQLMWRPKTYWKPGTKVTVKAPLTGVQTGPDKWVANDDSASFTIGSAMVSTVDIKRHTMTVTKDGNRDEYSGSPFSSVCWMPTPMIPVASDRGPFDPAGSTAITRSSIDSNTAGKSSAVTRQCRNRSSFQ